jgi:UDP-N-acetylglucosamine 2-epimerase (non-hydrolysing)
VFAGNVMIDTLLYNLSEAVPAAVTRRPASTTRDVEGPYGLLTLHRPSNVDEPDTLARLVGVLVDISAELPLVFPVHPRTRARLEAAGLVDTLETAGVALLPPQGYREMLGLMREATAVFTDSGGIQEETTALGVPCITLRESTERPITVECGTNSVVGTDPAAIRAAWAAVRDGHGKAGRQPEGWDGHAAERIVQALVERL